MVEHDELMHRAVAGLRASRSPAPGTEARVLAQIELQLGGGPGGGDPAAGGGSAAAGGSSTPVTAGWIAKVVGATASLTASGLLLLRLGAGVLRADADEPASAEVVASAAIEPADTRSAPTEPPPIIDAEPAIMPESPESPNKPRADKPSKAEPTDTLAAEAALIGAAKRASTAEVALELLEQHVREFPSGVMASEREALAVKALCQLERDDEARTRARGLIAQRPGLPLLDRMRRDCPALADLLRQTSP